MVEDEASLGLDCMPLANWRKPRDKWERKGTASVTRKIKTHSTCFVSLITNKGCSFLGYLRFEQVGHRRALCKQCPSMPALIKFGRTSPLAVTLSKPATTQRRSLVNFLGVDYVALVNYGRRVRISMGALVSAFGV